MATLPLALSAARLVLRDGTIMEGQFISGTPQNIIFQDTNGVRRRFDLNLIQNLEFNSIATTADRGYGYDRYGQPADVRAPQPNNNAAYRDERRDDRRNDRDWTVLPPGTSISVRNDAGINAENAVENRTFPATIVQDVLDGTGNIVIPRGSSATLIVRRVTEGNALSNGNFVLDLESMRVNGRRYVVNTEDIRTGDQGIGKNRRTAEYVGGGAVLGTLLGAVAGGGKGAAIGAIAGAAAGGGAQVLTKGHELRVPAETVLNFRLEEPLHLREM